MPQPRPLPLFLVALAVGASCASAPDEPAAVHSHRTTTTVTVTDAGLLPQPTVAIPVFSTVVWRNGGSQPLVVAIEAASCGDCETVLGFRAADHGARSVAIAPGSVASLCFHDAGRFAFTATVGATAHRGTIVVGGAP